MIRQKAKGRLVVRDENNEDILVVRDENNEDILIIRDENDKI